MANSWPAHTIDINIDPSWHPLLAFRPPCPGHSVHVLLDLNADPKSGRVHDGEATSRRLRQPKVTLVVSQADVTLQSAAFVFYVFFTACSNLFPFHNPFQ